MKISFNTALITGSSRGLGRAIAVKLAQEGVQRIAVHYLTRRNEAEKTLALLRDAGGEGVLVQAAGKVKHSKALSQRRSHRTSRPHPSG